MNEKPNPVSPVHEITARRHAALVAEMREDDLQDFEDAHRGFIATIVDAEIRNAADEVVWSQQPFAFLTEGDAPDTVHPGLWRQARLNAIHGLFEVCPGIYQVRGFDLANITFVETDTGVVIIDPLTYEEAAKAAFDLYRQHRGDRPLKALFYSHSHRDHFGGAGGVVDRSALARGDFRIYAPDGFMREITSEGFIAGVPMRRRSQFQVGIGLPNGPDGHVDAGLGKTVGRGTTGLIPPTDCICETFQRLEIDGLEIELQLTPGTEAPVEMNFYFPQLRALNMAENASHNMHNLCALRGTKIRDSLAWAAYLDESIRRYARRSDVVFAQHHWPVWGTGRVIEFLKVQRDLYKHMHDQTVRLMSHGLTPSEIAGRLTFPDGIARAWHAKGYYGAIGHNVAAIYAFYLGPYEGNPARLNSLPRQDHAAKLVDYCGGSAVALEKARADFERGEFRWVAELTNAIVFAEPGNSAARELCARALEQMGYQAECAGWRDSFLLGAKELRHGPPRSAATGNSVDLRLLPASGLFDCIAVRIVPSRLAEVDAVLAWRFSDTGETVSTSLSNGTMICHRDTEGLDQPSLTIEGARSEITELLLGNSALPHDSGITVEGDRRILDRLLSAIDPLDFAFPVLEPQLRVFE